MRRVRFAYPEAVWQGHPIQHLVMFQGLVLVQQCVVGGYVSVIVVFIMTITIAEDVVMRVIQTRRVQQEHV